MAKNRYIQDSFWTDPWSWNLDPSEKLLFIYLLTNPLCNVAGIYEIPLSRVAFETGFDKEMIEKMYDRFFEDGKLLRTGDWVVLVNFAKNQNPNPNVKAGMQRIIDDLPDEVKALKGFESLSHFTLLNLTLPNGMAWNKFEEPTIDMDGDGEIQEEEKQKDMRKAYDFLIAWADKEAGSSLKNQKVKEYSALKKIMKAGYTPDEVQQTFQRMLREDFWSKKGISFHNVFSELNKQRRT